MILEQVAELALRATALGCIVWLGLRVTRVRDPKLLTTVWSIVLFVALAMPALTPWMRVTLPAGLMPERAQPVLSIFPAQDEILSLAPFNEARLAGQEQVTSASVTARSQSTDWLWWATAAYLLLAGGMTMRLLLGIAVMCRVIAAARPVRDGNTFGHANVRITDVVRVPVTFGSWILLPNTWSEWSDRKRRIVLLHEGTHIIQHDFYRLLLASLYRAAFWFSPFAWWLHHRLADLAEIVSDDTVVAGVGDRRAYVDILLEMAGETPRLPPSGLAMAQSDSVPRRVERILATSVAPVAIGARKRLGVAIALLPLSALSAGSITLDIASRSPAPQITVDQPAADLAPSLLDRFVGNYQIGVGSLLTVVREGRQLSARPIGEPSMRLNPLGDHEFVSELGDEKLTFVSDGDGRIAALELRGAQGRIERGTRINATLAQLIETRFDQRVAAAPDRFVRQLPVPGGDDRLRQIIQGLQRGAPDYARMSPQLTSQMRQRASILHDALSRLGDVRSISFQGVGPGGYDIYAVGFANGSAEFRLDLTEDGTIDDIIFRPEGDGSPGEILDCKLETTLKSSPDIAPIRLSLINRSGADVRLFQLSPSGGWLASGSLKDGLTADILTDVARPLMIAGQKGQCGQIILPGRLTRVHVIAPGLSEDSSQMHRNLPADGSYQALEAYISAIRRGDFKLDLLTPQAASATRPFLNQRQAILIRLGPPLAMSFRGVTGDGSDIYRIQFANGTADWQIALTEDGRIGSVSLLP